MNKVLLLLFIVISFESSAQISSWKKLGGAEKMWVILHPFSAKKALLLSQQTLNVTDSVKNALNYSFNGSGSHVDAFRHAYWMSLLSARIGPKRALWLGKSHEKKNKKDFEKGNLEDGAFVDSVTIQMDLLNNAFGAKVGKSCYKCSDEKLQLTIIEALKSGELKIINQDRQGNFLNNENEIILPYEWQSKFNNERMLVPSDLWL